MDLISLILIAIADAMDCFAVALSNGVSVRTFAWRYALRLALMCGIFQAVMPLIGYFAGYAFADAIRSVDHWVAFGLLSIFGAKMILESFKKAPESVSEAPVEALGKESLRHHFRWSVIFSLAFATSIDALATGLVFVPFPEIIWLAVGLIGIFSFLFSLTGMWIGAVFGKRFKLNVNLIGGLILIAIGTKILIEHLLA